IITACMASLIILIAHIKLSQMERFANGVTRSLSWNKLARFLAHNSISIQTLADLNRVYGKALFATLLVNLPSNALFAMYLGKNFAHLPLSLKQTIIFFGGVQILVIFIFHLYAAMI